MCHDFQNRGRRRYCKQPSFEIAGIACVEVGSPQQVHFEKKARKLKNLDSMWLQRYHFEYGGN
jgi:hypothetical protein